MATLYLAAYKSAATGVTWSRANTGNGRHGFSSDDDATWFGTSGTNSSAPTSGSGADASVGITLSGLTAGTEYKLWLIWDDGTTSSNGPIFSATFTTAQAESGGSQATVNVTAAGAGTAEEQASGGSQATVNVTAAGAGTAGHTGGSQATVNVTAAGAGTAEEQASGGSQATVNVTAAGAGTDSQSQEESGGSQATVSVTAAGAGTAEEQASGGSQATVSVTAAGAGFQEATGTPTLTNATAVYVTATSVRVEVDLEFA